VALLGWSLDDRTERFSRDELVQAFTLERVNRAPASFDPGKLLAFQVRDMLSLPVEQRVDLVLPYLVRAGIVGTGQESAVRQRVAGIVAAAGDRVKVAGDIIEYADFFVPDDRLEYEPAAFARALAGPESVELLARLAEKLAAVTEFTAAALEQLVQEFIAAEGIKPAQIVHSLRVALTGKAVGFGLYDTMAILGRASVLGRVEHALERARSVS
jgi:glutamyl-tRNA synthetase